MLTSFMRMTLLYSGRYVVRNASMIPPNRVSKVVTLTSQLFAPYPQQQSRGTLSSPTGYYITLQTLINKGSYKGSAEGGT